MESYPQCLKYITLLHTQYLLLNLRKQGLTFKYCSQVVLTHHATAVSILIWCKHTFGMVRDLNYFNASISLEDIAIKVKDIFLLFNQSISFTLFQRNMYFTVYIKCFQVFNLLFGSCWLAIQRKGSWDWEMLNKWWKMLKQSSEIKFWPRNYCEQQTLFFLE